MYLLAEQFKVDGLPDLIYTKITEAQFQKYNHKSLLNFARILFGRPQSVMVSETAGEKDSGSLLEDWTISSLAEDFWSVMQCHCSLLREVSAATGRRQFIQRLLRARADLVDKVGAQAEIQIIE